MRDEMVDALDALATEYGAFSWERQHRALVGTCRADGNVVIEIVRGAAGWHVSASHRSGGKLTSDPQGTPCDAVASLMLDGLHSALGKGATGLVAANVELEAQRAEARRERDDAQARLAAMMRERDDIQQHAWQVAQERDALRAQLDEVAGLEDEMERRDRVAREKYAALERDRDLVENAMREASARAQRNEDNLKAVLSREEALKAAMRETQAHLEETQARLSAMTDARDAACAESSARLRGIAAATKRADVWQAAAADALAQLREVRHAEG